MAHPDPRPGGPGLEVVPDVDGPHDSHQLRRMLGGYAANLREQAAVLMGLSGFLQVENHAEAEAYLTVAEDLDRILAGELRPASGE